MDEEEILEILEGREGSKADIKHITDTTESKGVYVETNFELSFKLYTFIWRDPFIKDKILGVKASDILELKIEGDILKATYECSRGEIELSPGIISRLSHNGRNGSMTKMQTYNRYCTMLKNQNRL